MQIISWKPSLADYCVFKKNKHIYNTKVQTQTFCLHLSRENVTSTKLSIVFRDTMKQTFPSEALFPQYVLTMHQQPVGIKVLMDRVVTKYISTKS